MFWGWFFVCVAIFCFTMAIVTALYYPQEEPKPKKKKHHWWQDGNNRVEKHNGKYYFSRDCYGPPMEGPMPGAKPVNMDSDDYFL